MSEKLMQEDEKVSDIGTPRIASIGKGKVALIIFVSSVLGSIGGATGGYYAALRIPVPQQIAVMPLDEAIKTVDPQDPDYRKRAEEVADVLSKRAAELKDKGVVVIDSAAVFAAPKEAYIHVE